VEPLVSVRDLSYRYPDGTVALDGVDFELAPGECIALLGPNGSGKTTFTLCLNGLLRGTGSIRIAGRELDETNLRHIRQQVGMVFQDTDDQLLLPTVLDDVMFGPLNLGMNRDDARRAAVEALHSMHLEGSADRAPWHLSAGEKRRAAIAGVLAMNPLVLVLDEPTTSLDPPGRRELIVALNRLAQAKIVVTHDASLARAVASKAVFFNNGKTVAHGAVTEILRRFDWQ
jgi:cobalt/nickel transport system ATP-binding protein